jgi:hypothetical protein
MVIAICPKNRVTFVTLTFGIGCLRCRPTRTHPCLERAMRFNPIPTLVAVSVIGMAAVPASQATEPKLEQMPVELETQFALSAAPPRLRERASVYLLDPKKGYYLSRQGTSALTCIVQRTSWEMAEFRDDVYWGVCYDAAGTATYLKSIMDAEALRAQGMSAAALKTEMEKRYREKTYRVPDRAGISYMVGPVMRAIGPPDMQVHTMAMPHLMFYSPYLTDEDIGARPDFSDPASLSYPFIDKHGNPEERYMIQLMGAAESTKILADEKPLIDALCAYRKVLCLTHHAH